MKKNKISFKTLVLPMGLLLLGMVEVGASAAPLEADMPCTPRSVVVELAEKFPQFHAFLSGTGEFICPGAQREALLLSTLNDLKNLDLPKAPENSTDDLEISAIPSANWWDYFVARADRFDFDSEGCRFDAVAYIEDEHPGRINLCALFATRGRIERMQVLLHEVRHFDGFDHSMCVRGSNRGKSKACDESIQERGSYAVSVQASVAIALKGENFTDAERAFARASALYMIESRFNEETQVALKETLYLENEEGAVYEVNPETPDQASFVTQLPEPSFLYGTGTQVTVYPIDVNKKAYRMMDDFTLSVPTVGIIAENYNARTPEQRAKISSYAYENQAAMVLENSPRLYCPEGFLGPYEKLPEIIVNTIGIHKKPYFVGASGKLYQGRCAPSERVYFEDAGMTVPPRVKRTLELNKKMYTLSDDGTVYRSAVVGSEYVLQEPLPAQEGSRWIEMAKRTVPVLFEPATSYSKPVTY